LGLRSDFVSQCATYPDLREQMSRESQFQLVGALTPAELARAIALPLMQFALRDLFAATATRPGAEVRLTRQAYLARGGVDRALARHADAVLEGLDNRQRRIARVVFSRVVEIGSGRADTRRIASLGELAGGDDARAVPEVVQALADEGARLLTTGYGEDTTDDDEGGPAEQPTTANTVTLAHERLIDAWPWLRRLIDENREIIVAQNQIAGDARTWEEHGRDGSYLYTGARLATVEEQLGEGKLQLGATGKAFVEASIARRKAGARRRRLAIAGLIAITLVALLAALLAMAQARLAKARQLAADARLAAENGQFRVATLLALESIRREQEGGVELWRTVLSSGSGKVREIGVLQGHSGWVYGVAWSPDGVRLASVSYKKIVHIWDAESGETFSLLEGHTGSIGSVAWSPDGARLASGSGDATVRIWDPEGGETLSVLQGHTGSIGSVAWSPDGARLASDSGDGTVQIRSERYLAPPCKWILSNLTREEWRRHRGELTPYRPTCPNLPSPVLPSLRDSIADLYEWGGLDLFLTYQGWAVAIGAVLFILSLAAGLLWLLYRLVRWLVRGVRGRSSEDPQGLV
jgi:hypothetical protein